jgi:predicted nucleic acid-binding protein
MAAPVRYWDSCAFLGWLAEEPDKVDECRGVIRAAEHGDLRITTSALTLAEVIKLKSKTPLPQDKEATISAFFMHDYIIVRQLDRKTAERARELIWRHNFDSKDAVHVATALSARVPHLDTFDGPMIARSGQIGDPPLIIGRPAVPEQLTLDEAESDAAE